jgi:hypothetical protein
MSVILMVLLLSSQMDEPDTCTTAGRAMNCWHKKKQLQKLWMRKEMISNYSIGETTAEENLLGNQRIF